MKHCINERLMLFKNYWKINRLSKQKQQKVMEYFEPIISIRFYLGEPITGKNCNIKCMNIADIINK